jgi:hypothetical protein
MGSFKANVKKFSLKKSKPNKKKKTIRKRLRKLKSEERKSYGMGKKRGGSTQADKNLQDNISGEIQQKIIENQQGIDAVNREIADTKSKIVEIESTKNKLTQSVSENDNTKQQLMIELDRASKELTTALADAEAMKGNYDTINDDLQKQLISIKDKSSEELQKIKSKFQIELGELEKKNAELQQKYTQQKNDADYVIVKLQGQIEGFDTQIKELQGDGGDDVGVIANLQEEIDKNASKLQLMTSELIELNTQIENIPNVNENNSTTLETLQTENTTKKDEKIKLKKLLDAKSDAINVAIRILTEHLNAILKCIFSDDSVKMENLAESTKLSEYCEKIEAYFREDTQCNDVTVLTYDEITSDYFSKVATLNENKSESYKNKELPVKTLQSELNLEYFKELIQLYYFFVCVLKDADKEEIKTLAEEAASLDVILGNIKNKSELVKQANELEEEIELLTNKNEANQRDFDTKSAELKNLQNQLNKAETALQNAEGQAQQAEEQAKQAEQEAEQQEKRLKEKQESNIVEVKADADQQKAKAESQAKTGRLQADANAKQKATDEAQTTFDTIKTTLDAKINDLQYNINKNTEAIQQAETEQNNLKSEVSKKQTDVELKTNLIPLLNKLNGKLKNMQVEQILIENVIPKIGRGDGQDAGDNNDLPAKYAGYILVIKDVLHQVLNGNKGEGEDNDNNNITVTIGNNIFNNTSQIADNLESLFNFQSEKKTLDIDTSTITIKRGSNDQQYDVQYDGDNNPIDILKSKIDSAKTEYEKLYTSLETMKPIVMEDILQKNVKLDGQDKTDIQILITQINKLFENDVNVTVNGNNSNANVTQTTLNDNKVAEDLYILRFNAFINAYINSKNRLCDVITDASKDCRHNFKEKINKQQFLYNVIKALGIDSSKFSVILDGNDVTHKNKSKIDGFFKDNNGSFNFTVKQAIDNITDDKFNLINFDPKELSIKKPMEIILNSAKTSGAHLSHNTRQMGATGTVVAKDVFTSILDNLELKSESK